MSPPTKYAKVVDEIFASLKDQPKNQTPEQVEICKRFIYLFHSAFIYHDYEETRKLIHPEYKQHNASVGDGPESIIAFAEGLKKSKLENARDLSQAELRYKRILVDGDFLAAQTHALRWTGDRGENVFDIFRITDGLFSEHWDCVTPVPETLEHSNGIF